MRSCGGNVERGVYMCGAYSFLNLARVSSERSASVYGAVSICMGMRAASVKWSEPLRGEGIGADCQLVVLQQLTIFYANDRCNVGRDSSIVLIISTVPM